jgi:hypothetical protein
MALNFPSTPSTNATYTFNDKTWTYTGNAWSLTSGGALNTSVVPESTSLYFTNARAISAITNATLSNVTVSGTITVSNVVASSTVTAPNLYAYSDRSLKTNIVPIDNALEKIKALEGVYFTWKNNQQNSLGLIAQAVERVEPLAVGNSPEGYKTVNYLSIIGILIEAIKEQQEQIDILSSKINKL